MLDANGRANPYGDPNYLGSDAAADAYPPATYTDTIGPSVPSTNGFDYSVAQPQIHPLMAGAVLFIAAAMNPAGIAPATGFTFGAHAAALYNAEAEKTKFWPPSVTAPLSTGILGQFVNAPTVGVERLSQPTPWIQSPTVAPPATGFLVSLVCGGPQDEFLWQPPPRVQASATAPALLAGVGPYIWSAPGDATQPAPVLHAAAVAGPGILGAVVSAAPQEQIKQWPPPWVQSAVNAGPGFLGTVVAAAPQSPPLQTPPVWVQRSVGAGPGHLGHFVTVPEQPQDRPVVQARPAAVAGPGILGSFVWAWPGQDPTQPPARVQTALATTPPPPVLGAFSVAPGQFQDRPTAYAWSATVAGPGVLGAYVAGAPQEAPKQAPPVVITPASVAGPGILGRYVAVVAPQTEESRQARVQQSLPLIQAPPVAAPFYAVPEQAQGPREASVWVAVPTPLPTGILGRFTWNAPPQSDFFQSPPQVRRAAVAGAGFLGRFVAPEAAQDPTQPSGVRWSAASSKVPSALAAFAITAEQPQDRPIRRVWSAAAKPPAVVTGALTRYTVAFEQPQDRPVISQWPAVPVGPLTPAGPVAEIVAWAASQWAMQGARSCFIEGSGCLVYAQYLDYSGNPSIPAQVLYRIDDKGSRVNIVPWTALVPAAQNLVVVTAAQNYMVSLTRQHETHQVLFKITDGTGDVDYARVLFDLIRAPS